MRFCNQRMKGEGSLAFFCFSDKPIFLTKRIVPLCDRCVTYPWTPRKCMSTL